MRILRVIFVLGLGVLAFSMLRPYPPLNAGSIILGMAVTCLIVGYVVAGANRDERVAGKYIVAALMPLLLAGFLIANGALDRSDEVRHPTVVLKSTYGRAWTIVDVRSWRPGHAKESIYIKIGLPWSRSPGFFLEGKPVTIGVRSGALGMQWVSSITRN